MPSSRPAAHAILLLLAVFSQAPAPLSAQNRTEQLRTYFSALAEQQGFSGGVLVVEKGRVIFQQAYGLANIRTRQPNRTDLAFPIASISKTMTATAILQLEERGALSVDDPVARHLKGWPYPTMTIRHLLSHTSGLPPYNVWFDSLRATDSSRVFGNDDFLPAITQRPRPLLYQPGDKGNYDNINYIVLALIIEHVSRDSYEKYVQRHILTPARMRHTRLLPIWMQVTDSTPSLLVEPHLYPHRYSAEPRLAASFPYIAQYWAGYRFGGFGDYVSTLNDLRLYAEALNAGRLLRRSTFSRALTLERLSSGEYTPGRFGLGWDTQADTTDGPVVGHSGYLVGLSSTLLLNRQRQQIVIVFHNTGSLAGTAGQSALAILNGHGVPLPRPSWALKVGRWLDRAKPDELERAAIGLIADTAGYTVSEDEINELGYDLLGTINPYRIPTTQRVPEALIVFEANTRLFPMSWNVYDSYGEALRLAGRREEAIRMYRRSVELRPENEAGKKALKELLDGN